MPVKLNSKDYLWSYIGIFLSLFANIIMVPFVMHYLDGDQYGLWGVFQSLAAITALFDFGFATTFARNINYCWNGADKLEKEGADYSNNSEPNFFLMKRTMVACKKVFLIVSSAALIAMLTIGTVYIQYISKHIDSNTPLIAWIICSTGIFLNLYYGYFGSFLRGVGAISAVNKATVYSKVCQIVVTIIFLVCGFGLIGTSVAYLTYGTLFPLLARKSFLQYKNIGKGLNNVSSIVTRQETKGMFLIVWHNAWREGLVSLSNYLANQACTIIVSLYLPLTQTGAYSLGVQLANAVAQVSSAMYIANQPVLQSAYITNDKDKQKRIMSLIVFSFVLLDMIGLLLVTFAGLPLLRKIRPETVVSPTIMIALGIYQFVLKFRNCYTSYFSCTNRIPYVKAFLISSISCVFLSLLLIDVLKMDVWGIIIAQLISQGAYNAWAWTIRAHKEMSLSAKETIYLGYKETKKVVMGILRRGEIRSA